MKNPVPVCFKIASEAHATQTRWDGTPYMSHIVAVHGNLIKAVKVDELVHLDPPMFAIAECCALLHDVVEDCMTPDVFRAKLAEIGDAVMEELIYDIVVKELTHGPSQTYFDYVCSIHSKIGALVKYCDIQHNMGCSAENIRDNFDVVRAARQLKKYGKALPIVISKLLPE